MADILPFTTKSILFTTSIKLFKTRGLALYYSFSWFSTTEDSLPLTIRGFPIETATFCMQNRARGKWRPEDEFAVKIRCELAERRRRNCGLLRTVKVSRLCKNRWVFRRNCREAVGKLLPVRLQSGLERDEAGFRWEFTAILRSTGDASTGNLIFTFTNPRTALNG